MAWALGGTRYHDRAGIRGGSWACASLTGEQRTSLAAIADTNAACTRSYLRQLRERCSGPKEQPARQLPQPGSVVGVALASSPKFVTWLRTIRRYRNLIWNASITDCQREVEATAYPRAVTKRAYTAVRRRIIAMAHARGRSLPASGTEMTHYSVSRSLNFIP